MNFYDLFIKLCNLKDIKPSVAAREIGISKSNVSNWKRRNTFPTDANLRKIADYFGVTVDYLLGNETADKKIAAPSDEETTVLSEHEKRIITAYRNKPELQNSVNILLGVSPDADLTDDMIKTVNRPTVNHPINKN